MGDVPAQPDEHELETPCSLRSFTEASPRLLALPHVAPGAQAEKSDWFAEGCFPFPPLPTKAQARQDMWVRSQAVHSTGMEGVQP